MNGSCLCGAITFTFDSPPEGASVCHCSQCRKQSGHVWASAQVPNDRLTITGPVRWFSASTAARRGFCPTCGSFLFWQGTGEDMTSVSLGSLDAPTGITLEKHIFCGDKGDYYSIGDGLAQFT